MIIMQEALIEKLESGHPDNVIFDFDSYTKNSYMTHNFHPYPAKFIPQIPKELILKLSDKNGWILDPFCGSGTTLVEAKLNQRNAIGIDINPLSCLISKVKTTKLSTSQIELIKEMCNKIHDDIGNGKVYEIPSYKNIDLWFEKDAKESLSVIKYHIDSCKDEGVKNFLSVCFSAILVRLGFPNLAYLQNMEMDFLQN